MCHDSNLCREKRYWRLCKPNHLHKSGPALTRRGSPLDHDVGRRHETE
jgi:hypothetical protein